MIVSHLQGFWKDSGRFTRGSPGWSAHDRGRVIFFCFWEFASANKLQDFLSTIIPYLLVDGDMAKKREELSHYRKVFLYLFFLSKASSLISCIEDCRIGLQTCGRLCQRPVRSFEPCLGVQRQMGIAHQRNRGVVGQWGRQAADWHSCGNGKVGAYYPLRSCFRNMLIVR